MAKLLGQLSCFACASQTGKHKHRVFQSLLQLLLAATGLLEENMLPLLWYWLSSRTNKVLMLCNFRAATCHFLMSNEFSMESLAARRCCRPRLLSLLCSIFLSFVCLWGPKPHGPIRILCKSAGLYWWPVKKKGVYSDLNQTEQQLQMAVCKSFKNNALMSGVILNQ